MLASHFRRVLIPALSLAACLNAQSDNCSFRSDPDRFLAAASRARQLVHSNASKVRGAEQVQTVDPSSIERRNFIDVEIFDKLVNANVRSAPLASDEEFFRRVHLDLTGRIPSPAAIRAFLADSDPGKRDRVIDELIYSPEFVDKWAVWFGDWLKNTASSSTSNSPQQLQGRNAFYKYIWMSLSENKPIREMATELIFGFGNNYDESTGWSNFLSSTLTPGGPAQDTYDAMLVKTATTFLGLGNYDCLLCHNGRGRLDALSVWGKGTTRFEAQKMAAFFARTNLVRWTPPPGTTAAEAATMFYNNSYRVEDVLNRTYDLNTTFGNRPNRIATGGVVRLTPEYRVTGAKPANDFWRTSFADMLVNDPMFSRNFVNRIWKQLFNLALADPVDGLDPARLDPSVPPPDGWDYQATHPVLLEKLAESFNRSWYNFPDLVRLIVKSNAYQLSSRYDSSWNVNYVPLFARHYPRRLDGEEVHDAVAKATGVFTNYTQFNWGQPVQWAMQLMEPVEPRSNGTAAAFMNYFLRGNRDTMQRSQASTVQQQLALMNDGFVSPKLKMANSPVLKEVAKLGSNDAIVEEMFLTFVSRQPTGVEKAKALAYFAKATTTAQKNAVIEDLAWVLVNKVDFLFSY